jgi:hypothetical protein
MESNIWLTINLIIVALSGLCCFAGIVALPFAILFSDSTENPDGEIEWALRFIIWSFVVCMLSLGMNIFGEWKVSKLQWNVPETPSAVEHIVSLNDNNLVNGRFYMRRGYIDENLYYQYMVKTSDNGMVPNKISAQNATIYYDEVDPRIEWYKSEKQWLYFKETETRFKIFVPSGSVTEGYDVDLK